MPDIEVFDIVEEQVEDSVSGVIEVEQEFYFDHPSIVLNGLDKVASKCISLMCAASRKDGSVQVVIVNADGEYKSTGYMQRRGLRRIFAMFPDIVNSCEIRVSDEEVLTGDMVVAYGI